MQEKLTEENKIKLYILYIMKISACSLGFDALSELVESGGYIGYFHFNDVLSKMLESGDIVQNGGLYEVTDRGAAITDALSHLLPAKLQMQGLAVVTRRLKLDKSGVRYDASAEPESGGYRFRCKVENLQSPDTDMELSLFIPDEQTARTACDVFKSRPDVVYKSIFAMLTGNMDFLFD